MAKERAINMIKKIRAQKGVSMEKRKGSGEKD